MNDPFSGSMFVWRKGLAMNVWDLFSWAGPFSLHLGFRGIMRAGCMGPSLLSVIHVRNVLLSA